MLFILNTAVCICQSQTLSPSFPLGSFCKSVSLFLFCKEVCLYHVFFDATYKAVWLTLLSMTISRSIHVAANGIISFFLTAE